MSHSPGDEALRAVAAEQDGLVTRDQALDELSPGQLRTRLERSWQRLHSRVYLLGIDPPTPRQRLRAALLHAGPAAVLGGATACRQHGLLEAPDDDRIHLLLPHGQRLLPDPGLATRRTHRIGAVVDRDGFPTVAVARAVTDACRPLDALQSVRALACEAVQRRLVTVEHLDEELRHGPRAGSALLRRTVADLRAGVRSAPEAEVRDELRRSRQLPPAEYNATLHDRSGFLACVDVLFRDVRLVLEINSRLWHADRDSFDATMQRQGRLTAAGYTVLPLTPAAWRADPDAWLRRVVAAHRALRSRAGAASG